MNINPERFTAVWERFQEEANKLASGIPCSGMAMYYAIYQIVSSDDLSYTVRLHWCIGKFFFSLAMQLRERINGPAWIAEYARAFCLFEKTVETIDMLALHLNEAIAENKECRRIRELGYIIWERCILRHRYESNLPSLYETLLHSAEHAPVCLRSLEKILTNVLDPLEYYRNNYETGLVGTAVSEFKRQVGAYTGKNLSAHLAKCGDTIRQVVAKYQPLLLASSFPVLETALEKSIFSGTLTELRSEIRTILSRGDSDEIKELCLSLGPLQKQIFSAFLEEVQVFAAKQWPADGECQSISQMYRRLSQLLAPTHCAKTLQVLLETLSACIERPGIGLKLSAYLETIIRDKSREDIQTFEVLLRGVNLPEEKAAFYQSYVGKLTQRLLSLKFSPSAERMAVESLSLPWTLKRKVRCIFDDMVQSSNENELFCANHGSPSFKYPLLNNVVFFYAVVTTACMWPIPEEAVHAVALPETLQPILAAFEQQYHSQHRRRKLVWADTLSLVTIEITSDRSYSVEMPLLYYAVLEKVLQQPQGTDEVAAGVNISTSLAQTVLASLHARQLLTKTQHVFSFNRAFSSTVSHLTVQLEDVSTSRSGNRKPYYQAWISKRLKTLGRVRLDTLIKDSQALHTELFEWSLTEYSEALENLRERGFIEIEGDTAIYIP